MKNFDSNGKINANAVIFDRDGYLKEEVKEEISTANLLKYSALSDIVKYYYILKISGSFNNVSDHTILAKFLKTEK